MSEGEYSEASEQSDEEDLGLLKVEEERIDLKLLEECPVLNDYEKELLRLSYSEGKGPTEIGRLYGKDKSTIVPQRNRAYKKYSNWMEVRGVVEDVSRRKDQCC